MAGSATSLLAGVGDHRKGLRLLAMAAQTERPAGAGQVGEWIVLKRDDFSSNRHLALAYCWSMIFSENRCPLFGIMLYRWRRGDARDARPWIRTRRRTARWD